MIQKSGRAHLTGSKTVSRNEIKVREPDRALRIASVLQIKEGRRNSESIRPGNGKAGRVRSRNSKPYLCR